LNKGAGLSSYQSAHNLGIAIKTELPGEEPGNMKKDLLSVITAAN